MIKISSFIIAAIFALTFSNPVTAEIRTITQMEEIVPSVDQNTLVLFNISEVLLDSQVSLGTSAWRKHIKKESAKWKENPGINIHDIFTWAVANHIPHKGVEPITAKLIDQWQHEGIVVLALTSRGKSEWYDTKISGVDFLTEKMLKDAEIDFSYTQLPDSLKNLGPEFDQSYGRGILYASHHEKEELLKALLAKTQYKPSRIVMVDDKIDSIVPVEALMKELGIPFQGYCYRRTAQDHKDFNPLIADIQFEKFFNFGFWDLSDEYVANNYIDSQIDPDTYFISFLNSVNWKCLFQDGHPDWQKFQNPYSYHPEE